jgi:uncharacterized membrane protein (DUF106 family)
MILGLERWISRTWRVSAFLLQIAVDKEAMREAQRSEESRNASYDSRKGKKPEWRGEPDLDKLQIKRMKKAQRQRDLLGKQPMPAHYVKPQIPPLGSL